MLPAKLTRNEDEAAIIQAIADGGNDGPVLMLNLNRYKPGTGFPAAAFIMITSQVWKNFCPWSGPGSCGATRSTDRRWESKNWMKFWPPGIPATRLFSTCRLRLGQRIITACAGNASDTPSSTAVRVTGFRFSLRSRTH